MEQFDTALEKRVWQRVHGCAEPEGTAPGLQALALAEHTTAAVYLMLARMAQGPEKALLRQLYQQEKQHSRILSGISVLRDGQALVLRPIAPDNDRPEAALRKCYSRTLQAFACYSDRERDGEYGAIFHQLARQEQEHCRIIAEILGITGR
jgi:rubrerythrin